nr:Hsp70 family protein [uncultured Methanobrevibacter sp.]
MDFNEEKILIDEFFNGKFEVKRSLGEGSFAKVYLVNHNYLDTLMAMKIIKEPLSISTDKKTVFHEVMIACQLRHENILSIYDAAEISDFSSGKNHAYFVMEYVPGGDLEQFLNSFIENNLFMSLERSLDLIKQIVNGLNMLHSANPPIIHRDLKPNNVLLSFKDTGDIVIKISDFGFAKEVSTVSDVDVVGSRPYMAPELFNRNASVKSDIYAVGVIFYQLLTNVYPYDVDNYTLDELICFKPWREELLPPSYYNKNVFEELDKIVLKCLDFNIANRYDDAGELLEDIESAIDKYKSNHVVYRNNVRNNYDEYYEYIINDPIKNAFRLAKIENKLEEAIEILEKEIVQDYDIRKCYSETLRIWKSKRPDLALISKAFTVNLKGRNYKMSCNLLKEAIAYNPSLKNKYQHYIDLWQIFMDLERNGSLFKAVASLENLMNSSHEINKLYRNILPVLKLYSVEEIVVEASRLINLNNFADGANLIEFAVVCDAEIMQRYSYKLSMWKQNMRVHFKHSSVEGNDTVDYAIDLGATNSALSYFNDGNPIIINNHRTCEVFTRSAVSIDENDDIKVGTNANDVVLKNNINAIEKFKNNLGFSIPFNFESSSKVMFPEELSAEIFKDLRLSAYNEMGVNIEHAVICVPANSNPIKTRAINEAADIAGFRSHNLILDPIAVALAYDLRKDDGIWMVYDMGGETFNASLIHDNEGEIELIATEGLDNFGGNVFDWKLINNLFKPKIVDDLYLDDFRQDNPKYFKIFKKLKDASEIAKKELSQNNDAEIFIPNLFDGYDFRYNLTKNELNKILRPLIEYSIKICKNLLEENALTEDDVDKIILAGASSLSPAVQDIVADELNIEMEFSIDPLTVVAKGAAIYAGSIEKPQIKIKNQPLSVILNQQDDKIRGKVFSNDFKSSFLGYSIVFKNENDTIKVPLGIDGVFNVSISNEKQYNISIYHKDKSVALDEKSPNYINGGNVHIPYFSSEFKPNVLYYKEASDNYSKLLKKIEYLKDYSQFDEMEIQRYIETLLEISRRDNMATGQAQIYIDYLNNVVEEILRDMEFSILSENVINKIEIVKDNDLFEIDDIDDILENRDLDKLKEIHAKLIESYVILNKNEVIEKCFFNLRIEGIFMNNETFVVELFEKGQSALNKKDYDELLTIVNLIYELDER